MKKLLTLGAVLCSLVVESQELQVTEADYDPHFIEQGRDVMTLLRIPEACSWQNCSSWHFPTSIVVSGKTYQVKGDVFREEFVVCPTNSAVVVARGAVTRWSNVNDARIGAFAECAESDMHFSASVRNVDAIVIGSQTNMVYLTGCHGVNGGTLVGHNLTLDIRGPTNHLDFAVSLMNAGLVASEREPIQPRTVRRWEPTAEELLQWYFGRPRQPNTP